MFLVHRSACFRRSVGQVEPFGKVEIQLNGPALVLFLAVIVYHHVNLWAIECSILFLELERQSPLSQRLLKMFLCCFPYVKGSDILIRPR